MKIGLEFIRGMVHNWHVILDHTITIYPGSMLRIEKRGGACAIHWFNNGRPSLGEDWALRRALLAAQLQAGIPARCLLTSRISYFNIIHTNCAIFNRKDVYIAGLNAQSFRDCCHHHLFCHRSDLLFVAHSYVPRGKWRSRLIMTWNLHWSLKEK